MIGFGGLDPFFLGSLFVIPHCGARRMTLRLPRRGQTDCTRHVRARGLFSRGQTGHGHTGHAIAGGGGGGTWRLDT